MKTAHWISVSLLLVALTACSNTFLYNQLHWLFPWYVDDYVDLTRAQKKDFREHLDALLQWHREEELATYLALLQRIRADLQQPLSGSTVRAWTGAATAAAMRIEQRMLPLAFATGEQLSDRQMQDFLGNLRDRQADLEEEYLSRDDGTYIDESYANLADNLGRFLGRLNSEQKQRLRLAAQSLSRFDAPWLQEREAWIAQLAAILEPRETGWQQAVGDALARRKQRQSEAYREAWLHNQSVIQQAVAEVLNSRSEKQAARLNRELDNLQRDIRKLIARATPNA